MKFNVWKLVTVLSVLISSHARASEPAFHGMVLFGNNTHYISHLPMYHSPHDYQVVAQVSLSNYPRAQTLDIYESVKGNGQVLFTLAPQIDFDLEELIAGNVKEIPALLYSGHFERGGENLGPVYVNIEDVKYVKKISADDHVKETFQYVVVTGKGGESFAIHQIGGKPNRDIIAEVTTPTIYTACTLGVCPPAGFAKEGSVLNLGVYLGLANDLSVGDSLVESTRTINTTSEVLKIIYADSADLE